MVACGKEKKISTVSVDVSEIPSMHTENGYSLISDSGVTRYSLEYKVWDMYSNAKEPYWYFPEGVYLEKFDSLFRAEGSIKADTAYYYEIKGMWRLRGNVFIRNLDGNTFSTAELYWNEKEPPNSINSIYTDSFVRIDLGDRIIMGNGMRTNQYMTEYYILEGAGELYYKDEERAPADSANRESASPERTLPITPQSQSDTQPRNQSERVRPQTQRERRGQVQMQRMEPTQMHTIQKAQ